MAEKNPKQEKRFFERAAELLRTEIPLRRKAESVVILPKRAVCFHEALTFSIPADFRPENRKRDLLVFSGERSGVQLTAMRLPFSRPLHGVTAADLQISFRKLVPPTLLPEIRYGYLRHSPTLTASWVHPPAKQKLKRGNVNVTLEKGEEKTVLHLIQVRQTAFLLLFRHVTAENGAMVNAMIYSVSVDPEKLNQ
jgi:hypothetical protein